MKNFILKNLRILFLVSLSFGFLGSSVQAKTKIYYSCCSQSGVCGLVEYDTKSSCNANCSGHSICTLNTREIRELRNPMLRVNELLSNYENNPSADRQSVTINID